MTRTTADEEVAPGWSRELRSTSRHDLIDLGVEAPIEADGGVHTAEEHRRVSLRWLAGTVLTGFVGAGLIGSAIYASLGSQTQFAEAPQIAAPTQRPAAADERGFRKGDRLVKSVDIVAARQSFRTPTTITIGDREVVRTRGFTRVATNLTLTPTGFADDVPRFDPQKLIAGRNPTQAESIDAGPLQDEAEVSFAMRDLVNVALPDEGATLSLDEVQAQVTEHLRNALTPGSRNLPLPAQLMLMRTSKTAASPVGSLSYAPVDGGLMASPFSNIEVRMVPENVSTLIKTSAAAEGKSNEEKLVVVRRNEGLEDVLRANGASRELARNVVAAFNMRRGQTPVQEGQRVRLLIADVNGPDAPPQIARVSIYTDDKLEATVAMADSGAFVQVERAPPSSARPAAVAKRKGKADDDDEEEEDSGGMRLYSSFYETALKNDLPRPVIDELVRVFANDVDFQRHVNPGDNFEVFFADGEEGEPRNEVLFAQITARNETFKYYRFQTPDDNVVDYYDENGRSTRKFLMRKPMEGGETRSGFGMRRHPILGYARMHTGVDWAGPIGLPIVAAGAGTIIKAGRESGYGNRIEIQHANGYITTYNHLSGYARGVSEGTRVRQGQLIGYLGMTGLATGPHLHYEVIINGNFVDPMRVKLARTRELDGRLIANFRRERDRIEGLIAKAPGATRVAQRAGN